MAPKKFILSLFIRLRFLQDRMGAKKTFNITLIIWIICLVAIHQVVNIASILNSMGVTITVQWLFVIITSLAGMGLGSTQSSSRAIVGMFSPESKSGEFFGLWGLSGNSYLLYYFFRNQLFCR